MMGKTRLWCEVLESKYWVERLQLEWVDKK